MNKISDKVLNRIKEGKLAPKPRWQFWLRDGGHWLVLAMLVLLAALAAGLLIFFWSDGPWLHGGRFGLEVFFGRMPLLLLLIAVIGAVLAMFDFRKIGRGYRYPVRLIILSLAVMAILAGWLSNYLGLSQGLDKAFSQVSFYEDRESYMEQVWQNPDKGLIAGKISKAIEQDSFYLIDLDGKEWLIDASKALWRHNLKAEKGLEVKLIGSASKDSFIVTEVRPWMKQGGCGMMQSQGSCGMMR
jgi:hypothetical protein